MANVSYKDSSTSWAPSCNTGCLQHCCKTGHHVTGLHVANHLKARVQTRIDVPLDPSPFVGQALNSSKLSAQLYMAEQQGVLRFLIGCCCSIWRLATRGAWCPPPPGILGRALMWPTCQPSPPLPSWQKKSSASGTTSSPRPCPSR